ncbi:hypothetical protein BDZ97DRAFT_1753500 [Flammula alnicola]|nr:hypothetical protein BDZ97DRAFT_1753500 [Flammula alnicola]
MFLCVPAFLSRIHEFFVSDTTTLTNSSSRPDLDNTLEPQLPGSWQGSNHSESQSRYSSHAAQSRRRGTYRPRGRYQPHNPSYRLSRDELRDFAALTLDTLDQGIYVPPGTKDSYDLAAKIFYTNENTGYYPPDDAESASWATADFGELAERQTKILIKEYSTLVGARKLHGMINDHPEVENKTIGVLNFASAKKPGGGFINGAQAQEESIARSSTLYPSLITPIATQFYAHYAEDPDNAFYTHAMVYSPSVVLIRNDKGDWKKPVEVDVLTSAAVNAGEVRQKIQWQEDMRLLKARVKAAEAARAREAERRKKRAEEEKKRRGEEEKERKKAEEENAENMDTGADNKDTDVEMTGPDEEAKQAEDEPEKAAKAEDAKDDSSEPAAAANPMESQNANLIDNSSETPASEPASTQPEEPHPAISSPEQQPIAELEQPSEPYPLTRAEEKISAEMYERIARLLFLFHKRGAQHLVLGSFGTGVFQNHIELVAQIFLDLLAKPDGKFHGVFESVVFAILGGPTVKVFREVFGDAAIGEVEGGDGEEGVESELEDMQDGKAEDAQGKTEDAVGKVGELSETTEDSARWTDETDGKVDEPAGKTEEPIVEAKEAQNQPSEVSMNLEEKTSQIPPTEYQATTVQHNDNNHTDAQSQT